MKYKKLNVLPEFGTNTYLLWDELSKEALYIDCAAPHPLLLSTVRELGLTLKYLVNTHGHGDHIAGNELVKKEFNPLLAIHREDADMLVSAEANLSVYWGERVISPVADILLQDKDILKLGSQEILVLHTPGHSPGSICLFVAGLLFSGDTLFNESIGRTDLPGGDFDQLLRSIRHTLFSLPDTTPVLPGHDRKTTIGDEKMGNPFVGILATI